MTVGLRAALATALRVRHWCRRASPEIFGRYVGGGKRNHFDAPGMTIQPVAADVLAVVDATTSRSWRGGPCFWSSWVCALELTLSDRTHSGLRLCSDVLAG